MEKQTNVGATGVTEQLGAEEREALRREIGPPTDRDRNWRPWVSAHEVRALLDERDDLSARLAVVEAEIDGWDCLCSPRGRGAYVCPKHRLRAALHPDPSEAQR